MGNIATFNQEFGLDSWPETEITTLEELHEAISLLRGRNWVCRGQGEKAFRPVVPTIDRGNVGSLPRLEKLRLERQSISRYRAAARHVYPGEAHARHDDFVALAVLRHYGIPTRLLDWTIFPEVAVYFASSEEQEKDGEVYAFDRRQYEERGKQQWKNFPETTSDFSGDDIKFAAGLTAFEIAELNSWIILMEYAADMPRQTAQGSRYSVMSSFGRDHAAAFAELLADRSLYHRYIIKAAIKGGAVQALAEMGISEATLFPDSAGAARYAGRTFPGFKG